MHTIVHNAECIFIILLIISDFQTNGLKINDVRDNTLVYTNVGPIRGVRAADGNYTMFMGIPFAEVDKSNPFGTSTRYPAFEEPFEAFQDSAICPQREEFNNTLTGTLDCLQLNVYVPNTASPSNPLPVLVWIHGGAFRIGYANRFLYGPSYLVKHDVILVTINYRVGPYGFMCLDTPRVPGNQGLKDQLLGLRWVKENIEYFGGDPNAMTGFGQSVGSTSIHLHLLSSQEDFFQRVIMHSGSAFIPETIIDVDRTVPIKLAEALGYVTSDMNDALDFLSTQDTDSVISASERIDSQFWPCVESDHDGVEKFVTDYPINQDVPKIKEKSVLLGFNEEEFLVLYAHRAPEDFEKITIFHDTLKNYFTFEETQLFTVENIVKSFYLGGEDLSQEMMHEIANYHSDFVFNYPASRCIPTFLVNGANELFFYKFTYVGERNFVRRLNNITIGGALHTDELAFLFDMQYIPEEPSPEDQLMIDRMTILWTNFVKYGNPTPEVTPLMPILWEPIRSGDTFQNYLVLDSSPRMQRNPFHERMSFWNLLYDGYRHYQIGYRGSGSSVRACSSFLGVLFLVFCFYNFN